MTVGAYATEALRSRLVRVSTVDSYMDTIKQLDLVDFPLDRLSAQVLHQRLLLVTNPNTFRKHVVALRAVFREMPWIKAFKIPRAVPRVYDLPAKESLRFALMLSPFELQALLMMYAGLRVQEAIAVTPADLSGTRLKVTRQRTQSGELLSAKTVGEVVIPEWLAARVRNMQPCTASPGAVRESLARASRKMGIHVNPHMLRHWFCTQMVMNGVNPEMARRQMRHSDLKTTLSFYTQINHSDMTAMVWGLFNE